MSNGGQSFGANKAVQSMPPADEGHSRRVAETGVRVPSSAIIEQLAELQVRRKFYIGVVNKQTNAAKALARRALGWTSDNADREKVSARAGRIVDAALAGKDGNAEDADIAVALSADMAVIGTAIDPMRKARLAIEKQMIKAARTLPAHSFAKGVRGFGDLALAVIVGEAGDLSKYPDKGHLWKRLGLAPHNGQAYSTWRMRGGLSVEEWTVAGYSPGRRAQVYAVLSEPLFKHQTIAQGPYRAIYDRRRALTAETHADWTKAHSHMDALRVMTKYLLRDLWQEWRRVCLCPPDRAESAVPVATQTREAIDSAMEDR